MEKLLKKLEEYIFDHSVVCFSYDASASYDELDFNEFLEKPFNEVLLSFIDKKNMKDVDVYKKANIDRRHFSKMRSPDYHPSKNTIIKFVFALKLNIKECNALMDSAGYALTNSNLRDIIIMFFIENKKYDLDVINEVLEKYNLEYL